MKVCQVSVKIVHRYGMVIGKDQNFDGPKNKNFELNCQVTNFSFSL